MYQNYFGFDHEELIEKGALNTAIEIAGQPLLWREIFEQVCANKNELAAFLDPLLNSENLRIILTGAGSSAFLGEAAQGVFQKQTGRITQAIATTDLVTHPDLYFMRNVPTLMVSFARSGNSPESVEAVRLANSHCSKIYHLIITCNAKGELVRNTIGMNVFTFILPEAANDKSLAMTGSFTSMLLAGLLMVNLSSFRAAEEKVNELSAKAKEFIEKYSTQIEQLAGNSFERVIFLGSGPLLGIARECHLKLQELTDGKIICKHDSFLGFRHGPRVVVNGNSLIVYLFSQDEHVFLYERDLCLSIDADTRNIPTVGINQRMKALKSTVLDITFSPSLRDNIELSFISATLVGQILGFFHSIYVGLQPDNPSVSGAISRVVQGVTIYPETISV